MHIREKGFRAPLSRLFDETWWSIVHLAEQGATGMRVAVTSIATTTSRFGWGHAKVFGAMLWGQTKQWVCKSVHARNKARGRWASAYVR